MTAVEQLSAENDGSFRDLPIGGAAILNCANLIARLQRLLWIESQVSADMRDGNSQCLTLLKKGRTPHHVSMPALVRIPNPEFVSSQDLAWAARPLAHPGAWHHHLQFLADLEAPTTFSIDLIHEQVLRKSENEVTVGRRVTWELNPSSLVFWVRPRRPLSAIGMQRLHDLIAEWSTALSSTRSIVESSSSLLIQEVLLASSLREDLSRAPQVERIDVQMRTLEKELLRARTEGAIDRIGKDLDSLGELRRTALQDLYLAGTWLHKPVAKVQGFEIQARFEGPDPIENLWPLLGLLASFSETKHAIAQVLIA